MPRLPVVKKSPFGSSYNLGNEFLNQVTKLISTFPKDAIASNEYLSNNLPLTAYMATNLLFACELQLKLSLILVGRKPSEEHNPRALFNKLPVVDRTSIEELYDKIIARRGRIASLYVLASKDKGMTDEELLSRLEPYSPARVDTLKLSVVLKHTGDDYRTWRYIYESIGPNKEQRVLRLHWVQLLCFTQALDLKNQKTIEVRYSDRIPKSINANTGS